MIKDVVVVVLSLCCQEQPANTVLRLFNTLESRGQFVSTVSVVFGILIRFIVRNFLAFKGACGSDETGVVSTQHI